MSEALVPKEKKASTFRKPLSQEGVSTSNTQSQKEKQLIFSSDDEQEKQKSSLLNPEGRDNQPRLYKVVKRDKKLPLKYKTIKEKNESFENLREESGNLYF